MILSRIIKHQCLPLLRKKILLTCLIICVSVILMLSIIKRSYEAHHKACPSEINRKSKALVQKNIHILSPNDTIHVTEEQHTAMQNDIECVDVLLPDHSKKFKMCIYDSNQDLVISKYIKVYGAWERENVAEMLKALDMFPELMLVDLGSNIGTFTLPAALTGREVIAVDAFRPNHLLLGQSLIQNDLSCQVTLVHNAIHGKRGQMKINLNPTNIGGSVVMNIPGFRRSKILDGDKVDAVCLDDLVPMVKGRSVFLKMDIEGSEEAAFGCAHKFFQHVTVKVLLIEWINYRHNEKGTSIIKTFLESHNMVATWGVDRNRVIDLSASDNWPENVFWMEK